MALAKLWMWHLSPKRKHAWPMLRAECYVELRRLQHVVSWCLLPLSCLQRVVSWCSLPLCCLQCIVSWCSLSLSCLQRSLPLPLAACRFLVHSAPSSVCSVYSVRTASSPTCLNPNTPNYTLSLRPLKSLSNLSPPLEDNFQLSPSDHALDLATYNFV